MATVVSTPSEVFANGVAAVGKYCLTDEEAAIVEEQYRQDTLEAIRIVSLREREESETVMNYRNWDILPRPKKSWYSRLKYKLETVHESAILWYEDWKEGKESTPDKTFEDKVVDVRMNIQEMRNR
jgi:hypothetical protein